MIFPCDINVIKYGSYSSPSVYILIGNLKEAGAVVNCCAI